jgi:hypothetical protein
MSIQTLSSIGKADRASASERWTERRALLLWLVGSASGWALVLGLAYLARAIF